MFVLVSLEQVRAGEAYSMVFTFETNDWKRFAGLCLGHQKHSTKGMSRKKNYSVWNSV